MNNDPTGLKRGAAMCATEGHVAPKHMKGYMNCVRCGFKMEVD